MEGYKTVVLVCCLSFLPLVPTAHAQDQARASQPSFQHLVETMKGETQQEIYSLDETRASLLHVSRLIGTLKKEHEVGGNKDAETDACQLAEADERPEHVAMAFEYFTQQLNPCGSVAVLREALRQLECFGQACAKLGPSKASPERPAVTHHLQVLADRLNTSKTRLALLSYTFDEDLTSPKQHSASRLTHHHGDLQALYNGGSNTSTTGQQADSKTQELINKLSTMELKKQALDMEAGEVLDAITTAKSIDTLMTTLRQMLVNTQPSSSDRLPPMDVGPYCKGIIIIGPVYTITKKMLTEASSAALQLENAVGATGVKAARRELQCHMEQLIKFVTVGSKQINSDEVVGTLNAIDATLQDIANMQTSLENRPAQLQRQSDEVYDQISKAGRQARRTSTAFKHHRQARDAGNKPVNIQMTKVNIFQENELHPRCCY